MTQQEYQHLQAWCHMMGSSAAYTQDQITKAKAENAPANAIYQRYGPNGPTGVWETFDAVTNQDTINRINWILQQHVTS